MYLRTLVKVTSYAVPKYSYDIITSHHIIITISLSFSYYSESLFSLFPVPFLKTLRSNKINALTHHWITQTYYFQISVVMTQVNCLNRKIVP